MADRIPGKGSVVDRLNDAKGAGGPLPNVLVSGPPDEALVSARALAALIDANCTAIRIADCRKKLDITGALTCIKAGSAVLLQGIDALAPALVPLLIKVLKEHRVELEIGMGPRARIHEFTLPAFIAIATCGRFQRVDSELRACFAIQELAALTGLVEKPATPTLNRSMYEERLASRNKTSAWGPGIGSADFARSLSEYHVDAANAALHERVSRLDNILLDGLGEPPFTFDCLRVQESLPPFVIPSELSAALPIPVPPEFALLDIAKYIRPPSFGEKLFRTQRFEREVEERRRLAQTGRDSRIAQYMAEKSGHDEREKERKHRLDLLRKQHEEQVTARLLEIRRTNEAVNELEVGYVNGDHDGVIGYFMAALNWSEYPPGFP